MKRICTVLLLLSVCCNHAIAQAEADWTEDPYFKESIDTISIHGPRCITRDILQDRKGIYWFATWKGIISYDGEHFVNHTLKEGLVHFHVFSCYEDKKGNLWFGTARGGVYRYDGKTFKLFTRKDGLVDNNVSCVLEDKTGNIWLGTERGVSRYDGKIFTNFTTQNGLPVKYVDCILEDRTGKLWFGTSEGLYIFNGKTFTAFINRDGSAFKRVASLLEDKTGTIWIGTFDGLSKYDGKTIKLVTELPSYLAYYIIQDKKGTVWLSGSEMSTIYNMAKQTLYSYDGTAFKRIIGRTERGDNQIFGKIEDRNGDIWFGTMQGPVRYDGKSFYAF